MGCSEPVAGLVVPTGYSFNLDGTSIYLTMAAVFLAKATNTPLTFAHQVSLLLILMLASKGTAGLTGSQDIVNGGRRAIVQIPVQSIYAPVARMTARTTLPALKTNARVVKIKFSPLRQTHLRLRSERNTASGGVRPDQVIHFLSIPKYSLSCINLFS